MTSTFRVLATAIVVAVLVAGNVLTLANHRFQSKLHDWLSASVGSMIDMTGSTINQARAVEKENGRLRVEKQQLVVAMATLTATVAALQAANEILGYQNKTLASSIKTAEQGNIKRLMASRSLIAKVFPRVVAGAVRGVTTLVARAAPMVGIGVSLAVTGIDVKAACDSLQDLNELAVELGDQKADTSKACGITLPSLGGLRGMLP